MDRDKIIDDMFLLQDLWTYIHGWGTAEQKQQASKVLRAFGEHGAKAPEQTDITYQDLDSAIVGYILLRSSIALFFGYEKN